MGYEDFWWYISKPLESGQYIQQIDRSPGGYVPYDRPVSDDLINVLNSSIRGALEDPYADVDLADLRDFGASLLQSLVDDNEIAAIYHRAINSTQNNPLRLTLEIERVAAELLNHPWEYLYDPAHQTYLALHPQVSLVRGLRGPLGRTPDPIDLPIRLLVVMASPAGLDQIDFARESELLEDVLRQPTQERRVEVDWLAPASRADLFQRIEDHIQKTLPPLHIIHFICHGQSGRRGRPGQILLQGHNAERERVPAQELAEVLGRLPSLRLVILSACLTARTDGIDAWSGVAQALVGSGVPAVIGMQHQVRLEVAEDFNNAFYGTLFDRLTRGRPQGAFEAAVSSARRKVSAQHGLGSSAWGTPALYVCARIGDPFPLVPRPEDVSEEEQRKIASLTQYLSYLQQSLQDLLTRFGGEPLPPSVPEPIILEVNDLKRKIEESKARLRGLGVQI